MLEVMFEMALALAKGEVRRWGPQALVSVERAVTLPAKTMERLCAGMSGEDKAEAKKLFALAADAMSDALVFLASRGAINPDE
jgi:hypothetical protein